MLNILGVGAAHPKQELPNAFLESLGIESTASWIVEKIGIHTRRTALPLSYIQETHNADPRSAVKVASHTPTDLGVEAARMALKRAGLKTSQIGMVICNGCTPLQTAPVEAQRIAAALKIDAPAYDVFTACPAFALHLDFLRNFREEELPEYVLCLSTATLTQVVDYKNRSDSAIWGDGAAAWVVSSKHPGKLRVVETFYATDPTRCDAVVVDSYGYFHQDGRAVRDFSVRQTVRLIKRLEELHPIDWTKDIFIGHQANATMLDQITNNRGIPASNHWHNAATMGNQAAAGAPAALAEHWDEVRPGQKIVVAVVGAGLSWGSVLLEATDVKSA